LKDGRRGEASINVMEGLLAPGLQVQNRGGRDSHGCDGHVKVAKKSDMREKRHARK